MNGVFQGAFGVILKVWDDDSGNIFGIGRADDLVDEIFANVPGVPAQKNQQSAVAKSVTVNISFYICILIHTASSKYSILIYNFTGHLQKIFFHLCQYSNSLFR